MHAVKSSRIKVVDPSLEELCTLRRGRLFLNRGVVFQVVESDLGKPAKIVGNHYFCVRVCPVSAIRKGVPVAGCGWEVRKTLKTGDFCVECDAEPDRHGGVPYVGTTLFGDFTGSLAEGFRNLLLAMGVSDPAALYRVLSELDDELLLVTALSLGKKGN